MSCRNYEHRFLWDTKNSLWKCREFDCETTISRGEMNKIVEREVEPDNGHVIFVWPAQVEKVRKDGKHL